MAGTSTLSVKYTITLIASALFWIVPVSVKAPRLGVLGSFLASITGFSLCFVMAGAVEEEKEIVGMKRTLDKELIIHKFSLEEMVGKQLLEAEYFGASLEEQEAEEEAIYLQQLNASQQQTLKATPQQKLLTDSLPEHLIAVLKAAKNSGGSIKHRDAMRAEGIANKFKADEMKAFFNELQQRGFGTVTSDGRTYTFHLPRSS